MEGNQRAERHLPCPPLSEAPTGAPSTPFPRTPARIPARGTLHSLRRVFVLDLAAQQPHCGSPDWDLFKHFPSQPSRCCQSETKAAPAPAHVAHRCGLCAHRLQHVRVFLTLSRYFTNPIPLLRAEGTLWSKSLTLTGKEIPSPEVAGGGKADVGLLCSCLRPLPAPAGVIRHCDGLQLCRRAQERAVSPGGVQ